MRIAFTMEEEHLLQMAIKSVLQTESSRIPAVKLCRLVNELKGTPVSVTEAWQQIELLKQEFNEA